MRFKWPKKIQGVHPRDEKNTEEKAIKKLNGFETVSIPLDMQIGPGCKPLVKKGDHVDIGQMIGEPLGGWSVPVHASISGTVKAVKKDLMSDGTTVENVQIIADGKDTISDEVKVPDIRDRESFIAAVRACGMVGLGGAAFPTHVKFQPPPGKTIDTLIVNAAECEPYITSDYRLCLEYSDEIIAGILLTCHYLEIPKAVIGIEDNKKAAVRTLKEAINKRKKDSRYPKEGISIKVLPTRYPTGAEKVLIRLINGRIVPEGGLPADVGVIVQNISTIRYIAKYCQSGMPLVSRFITLDGSALKNPCNVEVPIGCHINDLIEKVGGTKSEPAKVIMGGPMMGIAIDDLSRPILKHNNAILVLDAEDAKLPEESACISCGRCSRACPMLLMPSVLDMAARHNNAEKLDHYHVMNCIECGSCSYVCPAKRYLVQNIRIGKGIWRQEQKNKKN